MPIATSDTPDPDAFEGHDDDRTLRQPGDSHTINRKLDLVLERQRTMARSVDDLGRRLAKHEERSEERAVEGVQLRTDVAGTRKSVRVLAKIVKGDGTTPSLTARVSALESVDKAWRKRHGTRRRTVREIFVQTMPAILLSAGGGALTWVFWYFNKSK